jgi:very-short-patch-repair endonuclease
MGPVDVQTRRIWSCVRRQSNAISHAQLRALGLSEDAIRHRVRTGRLHRKARGVYAVGNPNLTREGERMVAVLRCGEGAVLCSLSAAVHYGIRRWEPPHWYVTVPRHRNPRPTGFRIIRRDLPPRERGQYNDIPITSPLRTMIDCAAELDRRRPVEAMINAADARDLLSAEDLQLGLEHHEGEPGVPLLRTILDPATFVLTESEAERLFLPLAYRAGLPRPRSQRMLGEHRVDFYWPELNLVVEVDSLTYHRTHIQQQRDRERDHAHLLAERRWVRFTYHDIAHRPDYVVATLKGLLTRLPSYTRAS